MYCVMRTSAPSLYNVYRRYDRPIYRKIAASCTTRLARSRSPIIHLYSALETDIEGRCVSLQKAQRKRRHDYPDAEVARRDI